MAQIIPFVPKNEQVKKEVKQCYGCVYIRQYFLMSAMRRKAWLLRAIPLASKKMREKLNKRDIELWRGYLDDMPEQRYWPVLDAAEQAHAGKLKNALMRKRYAIAHGSLRQLLAAYLNAQPAQIRINKALHGKPYLADHPELAFNISHSDGHLLIAVGWNCELGVDIESCRDRKSLAGLVEKCFADEEADYWHRMPQAEKNREFYRFWTRKEAFVKATGRGIALGLDQCVINPERATEFLRVPESCGAPGQWRVRDINLGPDVCGALAVKAAEIAELQVRRL